VKGFLSTDAFKRQTLVFVEEKQHLISI